MPPGSEEPQVLVVDDEPSMRRVCQRVLERAGYAVAVAASGEEALRGVEDGRFATVGVALVDVSMPIMDGYALARGLHARVPALPVVLMSGHAEDEHAHEAAAPGTGFLGKPFLPSELVQAVHDALAARRAGDAP